MAQSKSPFADCTRFLNGHGPRDPAEKLREALAELRPQEAADIYGEGEMIEGFEQDVASLLGKEAAVFMPSGTMAQQIALRLWCDQAQTKRVAMHATSHLQLHEQGAMQVLHGLEPQLLADSKRLMTRSDLEALQLPLAAILWELPQREIGGQLPSWEALESELLWAKDHGIRCHLDGARLWEAAPFYDKSHADICAAFDSVYVSFYKGLGGIAGALLAGESDFIEASRPWLRRHGGNLISMYPYVLSARAGLARHIENFSQYRNKAVELAAQLALLEDLRVVPAQPQTMMMHLHIQRDSEALNAANERLAARTGVMLFGKARELTPGLAKIELSLGQACSALPAHEAASLFAQLLAESAEG